MKNRFMPVLDMLMTGQPVTVQEFETKLTDSVYRTRFSTYIWNIQQIVGGVVETVRVGKNVLSYQLKNVDEVKANLAKIDAARQARKETTAQKNAVLKAQKDEERAARKAEREAKKEQKAQERAAAKIARDNERAAAKLAKEQAAAAAKAAKEQAIIEALKANQATNAPVAPTPAATEDNKDSLVVLPAFLKRDETVSA